MDTKSKGDIAEQAVVLKALKFGWAVLKPVGDRLPYDLVLDLDGSLVKIQVKAAWYDERTKNYIVDARRTKTNRREMKREYYKDGDFDFAILYIDETNQFFVMPLKIFNSYAGPIHIQGEGERQRKAKSTVYSEAWNLIKDTVDEGKVLQGLKNNAAD